MNIVTPETVGLSSARLDHLRTVMQSYVDEGKLAGLISLVARRGKVAFLDCYGMMDIEANKPMQLDTILRIYSLTKPIASVAFMMLIEEGLVRLDDPVSKFIPEFKDLKVSVGQIEAGIELVDLEREMTVWNLLTHTAGLGGRSMYPGTFARPSVLQVSLQEMVHRIALVPLAFQPGSATRYSLAHDVIGYLVGLISGMPFGAFLKQRIFKPLGMEDTGFFVPEEKIDRFATLYSAPGENGISLLDAPAASPFSRPDIPPSGGVGLVSTVSDYLRFAQMLLNGGKWAGVRLLSRETVQMMTMNQLPDDLVPWDFGDEPWPGMGYGLGFGVIMDPAQSVFFGSEGTFGWIGLSGCAFWADPKEELILLSIPQAWCYWEAGHALSNLVYQAIVG